MDSMILVIEDDRAVRDYVKDILHERGYLVKTVADGTLAIKTIKKIMPDLVILDLGLPNVVGETVCKEAKKLLPDLPIILLTARNTSSDIVKGLNIGADDYVAKPFEKEELLARINARLREKHTEHTKVTVADLNLDPQTINYSFKMCIVRK